MKRGRILFSLAIGLFLFIGFASALTLQEQESLISGYNLKLKNYANIANTRALTSVEVADALNTAKLRKVQMLDVLKKDEVLFGRLILDSVVIASLPANIKNEIESVFSGEGKVRVIHIDDFEGGKSSFDYSIVIDGEKLSLYFDPLVLKAMKSSDYIKINGYKLDSSVFVTSLEVIIPEGGGGALPDTVGEQKVAVILIGYENSPFVFPLQTKFGIITQDDLTMILDKVKSFYKEASYGKVDIEFTIFGPYTRPAEEQRAYCNMYDEPEFLESTQIKEKGFSRVMYIHNENLDEQCFGYGTLGKENGISKAWIPVEGLFSPGIGQIIIYHELGHNFGLWHAEFLDVLRCYQDMIVSDLTDCILKGNARYWDGYGDPFDVMGGKDPITFKRFPYAMHFNAPHGEILGWISSNNIQEITSSEIYGLGPIEGGPNVPLIASSTIRVLKIPFTTKFGRKNKVGYYFVEYRTPLGLDNVNEFHQYNKGALLHIGFDENYWRDSFLIDADLGSKSFSINLGKTYVDPLGFFTLTTTRADLFGAEVKIDLKRRVVSFIRGDVNNDGQVDLSDVIYTLNWLFLGKEGPDCWDKADANDDGLVDVSDAVYILQYLFKGQNAPPQPYPDAGFDTTADGLGCEA